MSRGMVLADVIPATAAMGMATMPAKIAAEERMLETLAVEVIPGRRGVWLMAVGRDGHSRPLARFIGRAEANRFVESLDLARMAAHAAGRLGI